MHRLSPDKPLALQVLYSDPSFCRAGSRGPEDQDWWLPPGYEAAAQAGSTNSTPRIWQINTKLGPDHRVDRWGNASCKEEAGERLEDK